jgi:hypothetical protein
LPDRLEKLIRRFTRPAPDETNVDRCNMITVVGVVVGLFQRIKKTIRSGTESLDRFGPSETL